MNIRYVQNGNGKQCKENYVQGWEYTFAFREEKSYINYENDNSFKCLMLDEYAELPSFNLAPQYRTPFLLLLKY